jgi:hypothetical protein
VPWYIEELQKEWPLITGAPGSFAIAVLASGVLIWLFFVVYSS